MKPVGGYAASLDCASGPDPGVPGGFSDAGARFVSDEDWAFALEEGERAGTDVASVLISYGLVEAGAYTTHLSHKTSLPHVRAAELRRAAEVCDPEDIPQIARTGRIPVSWNTAETGYAAVLPVAGLASLSRVSSAPWSSAPSAMPRGTRKCTQ